MPRPKFPAFPVEATPVLEYIRQHVPRPRALPRGTSKVINECDYTGHLAWVKRQKKKHPFVVGCTRKGYFLCCPMGLIPEAVHSYPYISDHFEEDILKGQGIAIGHFGDWWDNIPARFAKRAVDFIWPRKVG